VLLLAITLGAFFVLAWPIALAFGAGPPVQLPVLVAHTTGMLAGYGVVVLIGLMSRNPALERGVGADRLACWHGRGGRAVVILTLLHVWGRHRGVGRQQG